MAALARGQASDCANPILDLFTTVNGVLTDVAELEFIISEKVTIPGTPTQVYPVAGRQTVDVATLCPAGDKLSTGRFVARWTPDLTEPIGTHCIQWFFKLTPTSPEQTFTEEFEVLPEVVGSTTSGYCSVQDLRDEGVPDLPDGWSDAQLQAKIHLASLMVDNWTGRFFEPRSLTFNVSGPQSRVIFLQQPIIEISQVAIENANDPGNGVTIGLDDIVVYNRHIRQNLLKPDDREDPRIELLQPVESDILFAIGAKVFQRGQQNVAITGVFGYTDPDGSPYGRTPELICHATKLITLRNLYRRFDQSDEAEEALGIKRIKRLRTRDQEIEYTGLDTLLGKGRGLYGAAPFTGDPEIDTILLRYRRPMQLGSSSGGPLPGAFTG